MGGMGTREGSVLSLEETFLEALSPAHLNHLPCFNSSLQSV